MAGHNERRRKGSSVYDHHHLHQSQQGEGSNSSRTTSSDQVEDNNNNNNNNIDKGRRIQITLQPLTNKHFQIRWINYELDFDSDDDELLINSPN